MRINEVETTSARNFIIWGPLLQLLKGTCLWEFYESVRFWSKSWYTRIQRYHEFTQSLQDLRQYFR